MLKKTYKFKNLAIFLVFFPFLIEKNQHGISSSIKRETEVLQIVVLSEDGGCRDLILLIYKYGAGGAFYKSILNGNKAIR